MANRGKSMVMVVLIFIIGLSLGYFAGSFANKKGDITIEKSNVDKKLLEQIERAKSFFPVIDEMFSVTGTITGIGNNIINIDTFQSPNPFEDIPTKREIKISSSTKLIRQEQKDPQEFQKEMEKYQKILQENPNDLPKLPQYFDEVNIRITDLKAGDVITVTSETDIKTQASFNAEKVISQGNFKVGQSPLGAGAPLPAPIPIAANADSQPPVPIPAAEPTVPVAP
jgi:hypothetical protein